MDFSTPAQIALIKRIVKGIVITKDIKNIFSAKKVFTDLSLFG